MKPKAIYVGILLSILFAFSSHAQQDEFPVLKGPYLGQKPPGMMPEIFAPGFVSTNKYTENSCSFFSDGRECYFIRRREFTETKNLIIKVEWLLKMKTALVATKNSAFLS